MTLRISALCLALVAFGFSGCGGAETPQTEQAGASAERLAERTRELQAELRATAIRLAEDPSRRGDAVRRLDRLEEEARGLEREAEAELDAEQGAEALRQANRQTADAAGSLREFAQTDARSSLADARAALSDARASLGTATDRLPADARQRLEDIELPEVP